MAKKPKIYTYTVRVSRKTTEAGDFLVHSTEGKLTEDEALEKAHKLAYEGEAQPQDGWDEEEVEYTAEEITDGSEDLKEE